MEKIKSKIIISIILSLILIISGLGFSFTIPMNKNENKLFATSEYVWDGTTPSANSNFAFSGGDGTSSNPYLISSATDFVQLQVNVNSGIKYQKVYFKLTTNISLNDSSSCVDDWASANEWTPIGKDNSNYFAGNFDGAGYTISNVKITTNNQYIGLFGNVKQESSKGYIKNLTLSNIYYNISATSSTDTHYFGGLAGKIYNYDIINTVVTSDAQILAGDFYDASMFVISQVPLIMGGLVGESDGSISTSFNYVEVDMNIIYRMDKLAINRIAGIIGRVNNTVSTKTNVSCAVFKGNLQTLIYTSLTSVLDTSISGLVGEAYRTTIIDSYVVGDFTIQKLGSAISNKVALYVGGIIGKIKDGSIIEVLKDSFFKGNITFTNVSTNSYGDIIGGTDYGSNLSLTITDVYNSGDNQDFGTNITATSTQIKEQSNNWTTQSNFNFDFDNTWQMGAEYPILRTYIASYVVYLYDCEEQTNYVTLNFDITNTTLNLAEYENEFSISGKILIGWDEDYNTTIPTYGIYDAITINCDLTLYAIWQAEEAYLHYNWKSQLVNVGGIDLQNLTEIEFSNDASKIPNDVTAIPVGSKIYNSTSDNKTYIDTVQAYLNGTCVIVYSDGIICAPEDSSFLFYTSSGISLKSLTTLKLTNFNTSKVTSMYEMFYGCSSLTSLDLSNFKTDSVTDMSYMFYECSELTSLDISEFNTSNVTSMKLMFTRCSKLTSLNIDNFITTNVTDMRSMFNGCSSLTSLDLSNFITENVTSMSSMFNGCSSLTSLDISELNTSGINSMVKMFYGCSSLTSLDVSSFNTSSVTDMSLMFSGCSGLKGSFGIDGTAIKISSNFITSSVTDLSFMFNGCKNITSLDVSGFVTSSVTNMSSMFYDCSGLTSLDLSNFITSSVTDLSFMFDGCSGLKGTFGTDGTAIKITSKFVTSLVTNMSGMFSFCNGLTSIDVSNFDTSNVTNMSHMFYGCTGLTSLDLSNVNTINVTDMNDMFYGCTGLTSLNLSNVNTINVKDMSSMFQGCSGLTSLDLSSFDTRNVSTMGYMFYNCSGLTSLDVSGFVISSTTSLNRMFYECSGLISLDLSNFDMSNVTNYSDMFYHCTNLTTIQVPKINSLTDINLPGETWYKADDASVTYTNLPVTNGASFEITNVPPVTEAYLHANWKSAISGAVAINTITSIEFTSAEPTTGTAYNVGAEDLTSTKADSTFTDSVKAYVDGTTVKVYAPETIYAPTSSSYLFSDSSANRANCLTSLTTLNLTNFDTSNVTDMHYMFYNCHSLTNLDLSNFNTSNVISMTYMFTSCSDLINLNVSSFVTNNVKNMRFIFSGCHSLTNLDVSNFVTSNVTDMHYMFYECSGLTSLNISNFVTNNVTDMGYMFYGCSGLTSLDLSNFNTSKVIDMGYMFKECSGLKGTFGIDGTAIKISYNFNTSNVTNMEWMFDGCESLTNIDVSNFVTSSVTNMSIMFRRCSSLTSLDLSNFVTNNVTSMGYMFSSCSSLTSLDISSFDTRNVMNMEAMFDDCSSLISLDLSSFDMTNVTDYNYMFDRCTNLIVIKTPKNAKKVALPSGNWYISDTMAGPYTEMIEQADSVTLIKNENITVTLNNGDETSQLIYYVYNVNAYYSNANLTTAITEITPPTKTGYTFKGYYSQENGAGTQYISENGAFVNNLYKAYTANVTLYANWVANTYTIIFNGNGATSGNMNNQTLTYGVTQKLTANTFVRAGYTFGGWSTVVNGEKVYEDEQEIINLLENNGDSLTLYAVWTATQSNYKIEHYKEDLSGNYVLDVTENLSGTTSTTVTATAKNYEGFEENVNHANRIVSGTITGDGQLTLKLYYSRKIFDVTLNMGTGIESVSGNGSYKYEQEVTISATAKAGYTWANWSGDISSNNNPYNFTISNVNVTLTANAIANTYDVTFNVDGGTDCDTITVIFDSAYGDLPESTKNGFKFNGWYLEPTFETLITKDSVVSTASNHTLYAMWLASTDTAYKVEHYVMNVHGEYESTPTKTQNASGTTNEEIILIDLVDSSLEIINGITYSYGQVNGVTVEKAQIVASGDLVIKLYYERKNFTISVNVTTSSEGNGNNGGSASFANDSTIQTITAYYDAQVKVYLTYNEGYKLNSLQSKNNQANIPSYEDNSEELIISQIQGNEIINIEFILKTLTITISNNNLGNLSFISGNETVYYGGSVTISALANNGYKFSKFAITANDSNYSCTDINISPITISNIKENLSISAEFIEIFSITFNFDDQKGSVIYNGSNLVNNQIVEDIDTGSQITLTLTPLYSHYYVNLATINGENVTLIDGENGEKLLSFYVTKNTVVYIDFGIQKHIITINKNITDISNEIVLLNNVELDVLAVEHGSEITIQTSINENGYHVYSWSINDEITYENEVLYQGNSISILVNTDIVIDIEFIIEINVNSLANGQILINDENVTSYYAFLDEEINITVTSEYGYYLYNWVTEEFAVDLSIEGVQPQIVIENYIVTKPITLDAIFQPKQVKVTLDFNNEEGSVQTDKTIENVTYAFGEQLTFIAQPNNGYEFVRWEVSYSSGDYNGIFSSMNNPQVYTLTADDAENGELVVKAVFKPLSFSLEVQTIGDGVVTTMINGEIKIIESFNYNDILKFTGVPKDNMHKVLDIQVVTIKADLTEDVVTITGQNEIEITPNENVKVVFTFSPIYWTDDGIRAERFASGNGTQSSPFIITNASELALMSYLINNIEYNNQTGMYYKDAYYKLNNDITLQGNFWEPIGVYAQNGAFDGVLDYDYFAISYATIKDPSIITSYENVFHVIGKGRLINRYRDNTMIILSSICAFLCLIAITAIIIWRKKQPPKRKKVVVFNKDIQMKLSNNQMNTNTSMPKIKPINFDLLNKNKK